MAVFALIDAAPARRVPWPLVHGVAFCVIVLMLAGASAWLVMALFPILVGLIAMAERSDAGTIFASRTGVLLGNASFAVYMIHTFFQVAAVILARAAGWTSIPALIAVASVTYVVIVAASIASFRWFEDPLRRRLSRKATSGRLEPQVTRAG
jgi:peptidoglycan/LPS O-acetylase OafA/YrhL